jgi:phosphatidate cytidylyltransferase
MLQQRLISAAIGLPIFIIIVWLGNPWFALLLAIIAILGSIEFYRMTSHNKIRPIAYFGVAISFLIIISPYYPNFITKPCILTFAIIISLIWLLFQSSKEGAFNNWAWIMAGILYIGWTISYWAELRNLEHGREWMLCSILTVMASDTGAFFVGKTWGKHYLAPTISPKKTWEGAIGGLLCSIIASIILGIVFSLPLNYWGLVLLGFIISTLAQLGDLVESLLKRNTSVKDSGNLIPGHGGILDRIDSFIFTGVAVYYCAIIASIH